MPLSKADKIILIGAGGFAAAIGIAALAKKAAAAPVGAITTIPNLIPPYIDSGTIVVKQIGNAGGPSAFFAFQPGTSIPSVEFVCDNPLGTPTAGYAYLQYDLTHFGNARIVLHQIDTLVQNNIGWATITARLNVWDQTGVDDSNYFKGTGSPGFITGKDLLPSVNTNTSEAFNPEVDVTGKTALTLEVAFSGADFPVAYADAWFAPYNLYLEVTQLVTVQVNVDTDGGVLLSPNSASVTVANSAGVVVASGTTTTGTISFPNLEADTFTISVTVGSRTDTQLAKITSGTGIVSFSFLHPIPTFTISPSPASPGQTVTLNPAGTTDPQGFITQQSWLVQAGTAIILSETLTPTSPSFLKPISYVTPSGTATETVSMTVTNDAGLSATATSTELVTNFGTVNITLQDDMGTLYSGIEVDLYDSTNALVAKTLSNAQGIASFSVIAGTYTAKAKLALNGAPGITKSVAVSITIGTITSASIVWNHPVAVIKWLSAPNVTDVNFPAILQASGSTSGEPSDPTIFYAKYTWGDGTSNDTLNTGGLLTAAAHSYSAPTAVSITLLVENDAGLSSIVAQGIIVNPALTATVSYTPSVAVVGGLETISANPAGGTLPYFVIQFNFGDGTSSVVGSGSPVTHTYASPGTYTITATVSDAVGEITASTTITVILPVLHDTWLYPNLINYNSSLGIIQVAGVLALLGDCLARGVIDILTVSAEAAGFQSVPVSLGGNGEYDISEDFNNDEKVEILDISTQTSRYRQKVDLAFINGQTVEIQAYSPASGGWVTLASAPTGVATIPFKSGIYAQKITANGVFFFSSNLGVPLDITMIRFVFAGNPELKPLTSPGFGVTQPLR